MRAHQRCEGSPVHEWGVYHPPPFLCISLLLTGVHSGFPFGLTVFPSHPPGSEGLLDRCLTKPCTWLWGILHSRLSQLKNN